MKLETLNFAKKLPLAALQQKHFSVLTTASAGGLVAAAGGVCDPPEPGRVGLGEVLQAAGHPH